MQIPKQYCMFLDEDLCQTTTLIPKPPGGPLSCRDLVQYLSNTPKPAIQSL